MTLRALPPVVKRRACKTVGIVADGCQSGAGRTAKLVAAISLTTWTPVIIAGRLLPQFALEG